MIVNTNSVEQTRNIAARLARKTSPGQVFALAGDLGSGKTEFVRGFVHELSPDAQVRSPTFSIVNTYPDGPFPVFHFDFYRLGDPSELDQIGFEEYVNGQGVCLIEWASMFQECLPKHTIIISFTDTGLETRRIESALDW